jgi:hypothetical protein
MPGQAQRLPAGQLKWFAYKQFLRKSGTKEIFSNKNQFLLSWVP